MNERERLIGIFRKINYLPYPDIPETMRANLANQFTDYALDIIADYLLENGVVVLPCRCNKCSHRCNNTNECGIYGRVCTENGYCDKALKGGNENE